MLAAMLTFDLRGLDVKADVLHGGSVLALCICPWNGENKPHVLCQETGDQKMVIVAIIL